MIIRALAETVRLTNRNTKGVKVINLDKGARVVGLARYAAGDEEELEEGEDGAESGEATAETAPADVADGDAGGDDA